MVFLDGKVIVVTGAARGLGRSYALELAALGARVVVNDLGCGPTGKGSDKRPASDLVALIEERGGNAIANAEDVSTWDGAARAVAQGIEVYGRLDGLVNNAGVISPNSVADITADDLDRVFRSHLYTTITCTRHACSYWRDEHRAGRAPRAAVVNTTSESAMMGIPFDGVYGAAKAGIVSFTLSGSLDAACYGVRMNAIAPRGLTRLINSFDADAPPIEIPEVGDYQEASASNPANVAPLVAWLLSDDAAHVTGQIFKTMGTALARVQPWSAGPWLWPPEPTTPWQASEIGPAINAAVFQCRHADARLEVPDGPPVAFDPRGHL